MTDAVVEAAMVEKIQRLERLWHQLAAVNGLVESDKTRERIL